MILRKNVNKKNGHKPDFPKQLIARTQLIRLSLLGRSEDLALETYESYEAH